MSAWDDRRRLAQARRITAIKERRAERERCETARAERDARERKDAAWQRAQAAADLACEAQSAFFAQRADPHVETWLIVTADRAQAALQHHTIAAESHDTAQSEAAAARQLHDRLLKRAEQIEARTHALGRLIAARVQERDDQQTQERPR